MSYGEEDKLVALSSQLCSHTKACEGCGKYVCENCYTTEEGSILCNDCSACEGSAEQRYQQNIASWVDCNRCTLSCSRTQPVFGTGNKVDPSVFIIGQGPGATEDQGGVPFSGRVSWHLNAVLEKVGLSRDEDCYLTNTVACRPWIPELNKNRAPTMNETLTCRPRLDIEFQRVAETVKVVVMVGKEAYMTYKLQEEMQGGGFNPASIRVGDTLGWHEDTNPVSYSVYHPSYIARQGPLGTDRAMQMLSHQAWLEDWKRIAHYVKTGELTHFRKAR